MAQVHKPLPALYTVYVLRSTIRHASLYIGSTPNPPRRLKQHNGEVKGGAVRTSRAKLRPWEMIALVSGFPSMVAALKFEWALTNPHLSLHIPDESRLAVSTSRKKSGMPRRPVPSLRSIMSNIHLLTGVPSFMRWPLNLHFFNKDAKKSWEHWLKSTDKIARVGLRTLEDFGPAEETVPSSQATWGAHALPVDYLPMKDYIQKAQNIAAFEQEGPCVHCHQKLASGGGLHPMCPNDGCEAIGHLDCWAKHALKGEDALIPDICECPSCGGEVRWGDMMKELSLRVRGEKEVEKLLTKKRRGKKAMEEE